MNYERCVDACCQTRAHAHPNKHTHIHTPTDPAPLILHFQPLGPPVEVDGLDQ